MQLLGLHHVCDFTSNNSEASGWLGAWCAEVEQAVWTSKDDVLARYRCGPLRQTNQFLFLLKDGEIAVSVQVRYSSQIVLILGIAANTEVRNAA